MRVVRETPIKNSGRVMQVRGMFDVPEAPKDRIEWDSQLGRLAEKDWQVGLIVGPSGAGKSTLAREHFGSNVVEPGDLEWPEDRAIIDAFPKDMGAKDITGLLSSVGLGSPPAWLRPFHTLSTGEQFRAFVARALAERPSPIVLDEFSSVVDRQVAQVGSHAIQKSVRRTGKKLVAVTCHFDVIDWLQPDWVYRPDTVDFEWRRLQRHPSLDIQITELPKSAWPPFSRYHYLSPVLHAAAKCYGMWLGEECIAFNCHIPFPHPSRKNIRMGHRLVVLPDYQGLGLGGRFDDWLGQHLWDQGYRYHKTISHPALIHYFARSPRWQQMAGSNRPTRGGAKRLHKTMQNSRKLATRSFRYVAPRASGLDSSTAKAIA